jgi:glycine dehydrogenase subunit 2
MNALNGASPNASGWKPEMGDGGPAGTVVTASGDRGLMLEEALIFELGRPGTCGVDLDGDEGEALPGLAKFLRAEPPALPGLSEPETVRHYTRLSRQNYAIDLGPFPLGSCTMKHNPRLNEKVARMAGFADVHPLQPQQTVRGAIGVIVELADWLVTLTGMSAVAMSPKAGAHGELCGLLCIRAALEAPIRPRLLLPGTGWNPSRRPRMAGSTWRR